MPCLIEAATGARRGSGAHQMSKHYCTLGPSASKADSNTALCPLDVGTAVPSTTFGALDSTIEAADRPHVGALGAQSCRQYPTSNS